MVALGIAGFAAGPRSLQLLKCTFEDSRAVW